MGNQFRAMLHTSGIQPVARIVGQISPAERRAEPLEQTVIAGSDHDIAVRCLIGLIRHDLLDP